MPKRMRHEPSGIGKEFIYKCGNLQKRYTWSACFHRNAMCLLDKIYHSLLLLVKKIVYKTHSHIASVALEAQTKIENRKPLVCKRTCGKSRKGMDSKRALRPGDKTFEPHSLCTHSPCLALKKKSDI